MDSHDEFRIVSEQEPDDPGESRVFRQEYAVPELAALFIAKWLKDTGFSSPPGANIWVERRKVTDWVKLP